MNEVFGGTGSTPAGAQVEITNTNWDSSKVEAKADGLGNTIPIPQGSTYKTGNQETGFVISADGNEFVWIPVAAKSLTYGRYSFGSFSDSDYSETMPSDEQTSVNTYGGYYIARYEAGVENYDSSKTSTTKDGTTTWTGYTAEIGKTLKVVSKQGAQVWNYITRDKAIEVASSMQIANGTTKLCSSYAWDTALKYIDKTSINSSYSTNSEGGVYGESETKNTGNSIPVSNIYDMGGNVYEWTTESYSTRAVLVLFEEAATVVQLPLIQQLIVTNLIRPLLTTVLVCV